MREYLLYIGVIYGLCSLIPYYALISFGWKVVLLASFSSLVGTVAIAIYNAFGGLQYTPISGNSADFCKPPYEQ